jgi:hypothetical protein
VADLVAIRASIAAQIGANAVPSLTASAQLLDSLPSLPMFLVLPTRPAARFDVCMGAGLVDGSGRPVTPTEFTLKGILPISRGDTISNVQDTLDQWCGYQSTPSVVPVAMAIDMDISLGGTVEWCIATLITDYGPISWSGVEYFGATFQFEVSAR